MWRRLRCRFTPRRWEVRVLMFFRLTTFRYLCYAKRWHWFCLSWETTCSWNILKISSLNLQKNGFTFQSHLSNTFKSLKSSLKRSSLKWQKDVKFCFASYDAHFVEHFKVSQSDWVFEWDEKRFNVMWGYFWIPISMHFSTIVMYHAIVRLLSLMC